MKKIVAVSELDAHNLRSLYGASRVGVGSHRRRSGIFRAASTPASSPAISSFSAQWTGGRTSTACIWFTRHVLPRIRRRLPDCTLAVVGRNPAAEVCGLAESDQQIHVTGTVDDVRPYLWESAVSIVPLRIGGGTRLKIYEAMAAKIPVVSTSVGAEGLDIRDGENIAIADSPQEFADRCLALLADTEARRRMASNAWEMVSTCYSWEVVSSKFEQLLHDPFP